MNRADGVKHYTPKDSGKTAFRRGAQEERPFIQKVLEERHPQQTIYKPCGT